MEQTTLSSSTTASFGRVLIVSQLLDSWLIFYAQALTQAGYDVTLAVDLDSSVHDHDHRDILKYFLPNPFCRLIGTADSATISATPSDFAVAGLQGASTLAEKQKILSLLGSTPLRAVVLRRYSTELPAMARLLVKEVRHPFLRRADRILVEEYRNASWCLGLLASPARLGIVPHQRVTCQGMPEGIDRQKERAYLFNFLGTYDGDPVSERVPIIDHLEARFGIMPGAQDLNLNGKTARIMWHADRPGFKRDRPLNEYLDTLGGSYFTLCMSGDTATTHRVLEAIQCGSIPVLSEQWMPHYDLPLKHGHNCWLVRNKDWETTVHELAALDLPKILEIQAEVKKLALNEASIPFLEGKCLRLLGLKTP